MADEVVVSEDVIAAAVRGRVPSRRRARRATPCPASGGRCWTMEPSCSSRPTTSASALRRRKSPAERELLRAAGRLGRPAMAAALDGAMAGRVRGARSRRRSSRASSRRAARSTTWSSRPDPPRARSGPRAAAPAPAGWTTRRLAAGELLRIDAYGSVGGYLFDFARSTVVGGTPRRSSATLIEALRDAVPAGIEGCSAGVPLADVAARCETCSPRSAHALRHGVPAHMMGGFWGHGLGVGWEPPWIGSRAASSSGGQVPRGRATRRRSRARWRAVRGRRARRTGRSGVADRVNSAGGRRQGPIGAASWIFSGTIGTPSLQRPLKRCCGVSPSAKRQSLR